MTYSNSLHHRHVMYSIRCSITCSICHIRNPKFSRNVIRINRSTVQQWLVRPFVNKQFTVLKIVDEQHPQPPAQGRDSLSPVERTKCKMRDRCAHTQSTISHYSSIACANRTQRYEILASAFRNAALSNGRPSSGCLSH